jgi:hypothetical protein
MSTCDSRAVVLIIYRVLLDDVLAAVDSQVARQVFGVSPAWFLPPTGISDTTNAQIKLLAHVDYLRPRPDWLLRTASRFSRSSINCSASAAVLSSSQDRIPILSETKQAISIS